MLGVSTIYLKKVIKLTKLDLKNLTFLLKLFAVSLLIHNTYAIDGGGIICLNPDDKSGKKDYPKMYYFDSERVQEFIFREVIKKGAVLASEKNIILKKSDKFKFRAPRPNYVYWQEKNKTMIYNLQTNSLKVKILDETLKLLECPEVLSKTEFFAKMMKWEKLYNMKLDTRP